MVYFIQEATEVELIFLYRLNIHAIITISKNQKIFTFRETDIVILMLSSLP